MTHCDECLYDLYTDLDRRWTMKNGCEHCNSLFSESIGFVRREL